MFGNQTDPTDIIYEVEGADIDNAEQTDVVFLRDGRGNAMKLEVEDDVEDN